MTEREASSGDAIGPNAHLLVTGGAGFIGSELVRRLLGRRDGTRVTVLDKLTYAGNRANLAAVEADDEQAARFAFVHGDIADPEVVGPLVAAADAVINVAAETHVDRSILDPEAFLRTGVIGVHVLLEAVRGQTERARAGERAHAPRFLQVSTDEVYGEVSEGRSVETDVLAPRSPYAAAKASGELLVRAYQVTFGLDAVITRGSNTYGPYQHPEKLIPLFVTNALAGEPLPMYGDGMQVRDWLHVSDHAAGIEFVLRHGLVGRGLQPGRRERTAEPRGDRAAAGGDGARLVAGPIGAGPARATTAGTRWTGRRRPRSAGGRWWRSSGASPRRLPGIASTPTGCRPPDPATGTPTTPGSTAIAWPPARRWARPADGCARPLMPRGPADAARCASPLMPREAR